MASLDNILQGDKYDEVRALVFEEQEEIDRTAPLKENCAFIVSELLRNEFISAGEENTVADVVLRMHYDKHINLGERAISEALRGDREDVVRKAIYENRNVIQANCSLEENRRNLLNTLINHNYIDADKYNYYSGIVNYMHAQRFIDLEGSGVTQEDIPTPMAEWARNKRSFFSEKQFTAETPTQKWFRRFGAFSIGVWSGSVLEHIVEGKNPLLNFEYLSAINTDMLIDHTPLIAGTAIGITCLHHMRPKKIEGVSYIKNSHFCPAREGNQKEREVQTANLEKDAQNILAAFAAAHNLDEEQTYIDMQETVKEKYQGVHNAFEAVVMGETTLEELGVPKQYAADLTQQILTYRSESKGYEQSFSGFAQTKEIILPEEAETPSARFAERVNKKNSLVALASGVATGIGLHTLGVSPEYSLVGGLSMHTGVLMYWCSMRARKYGSQPTTMLPVTHQTP